jgi:small subunit ribosomal protein S8e
MPRWHIERGRKPTGGMIRVARKKRKHELGSTPIHPRIGEERRLVVRTKGGGLKVKAASMGFANLALRKGVIKRVRILRVLESPANPDFVRMGIVTKGCVVETELGRAKVTSRPSQHGVVNAVLIKK